MKKAHKELTVLAAKAEVSLKDICKDLGIPYRSIEVWATKQPTQITRYFRLKAALKAKIKQLKPYELGDEDIVFSGS